MAGTGVGRREEKKMGLLRQVWREIGARPGVTVVALLTLGTGIAINTLVFSGVYALLLREQP
jgi:hypothetical protein